MIVVAEIGSNGLGRLDLNLKHIDAAAKAGADAVKFQLFVPEKLDSRPDQQAELAKYVLKPEWLTPLRNRAYARGLKFIVTPFDIESCLLLEDQVDMVKISAYDLTFDALLHAAMSLKVPIVLSTAMATMSEIYHALEIVENSGHENYWLHGVAQYPANEADYNLSVMLNFRDNGLYYGVSDHTIGATVPMLATALGADMIEKHFRMSEVTDSPDAGHSLHEFGFAVMVEQIKRVQAILGDYAKNGPLPCEIPLYETCRRSDSKPLRG